MTAEPKEIIIPEVMKPQLAVVQDAGLASTLASNFVLLLEEAEKWKNEAMKIVVTDASQTVEIAQARNLRLNYKRIRCAAESKRKELKESIVRQGKAIDGIANIIKCLIEPIEAHLEQQEQFVEQLEIKRKAKLAAARGADIAAFGLDPSTLNLGDMDDDTYVVLYDTAEKNFNARKAAEEQARKEADERLRKDAEERERIKADNERLRREAADRDAKAREEREAAESVARKQREENDRIVAEERRKREAAEKEVRDREAAEQKKRDDEAAAKARAASAPDREKIDAFIASLQSIHIPLMATERGIALANKIAKTRTDWIKLIQQQAAEL